MDERRHQERHVSLFRAEVSEHAEPGVVGLQFTGATPAEGPLARELVRILKDAG